MICALIPRPALCAVEAPTFCSSLCDPETGSGAEWKLSVPESRAGCPSYECNDTASLGRGEGREDIGTGNRVGPQCLLHKRLMAETGPESGL